jgi:hypothetical protein
MAWQLVYTSAPELLDAGRTGFGTVAKHEAIRPSLQMELERISQFSRKEGLNIGRIIFSHQVLDLRGERFHVLSRIRDAGADYTGRTNHIAHHIVLTSVEADRARANQCTPADVIQILSESGIWRDSWHESKRLLTASEEIDTGSIPALMTLPAVTWESVTRSRANAAILAPGGGAAEGCWILYGAGQAATLLPMIGESLCLHPDPWAISFTTDIQPTDRIEDFRWRGVSAGSPMEGAARDSARPKLDLAKLDLPNPVESAIPLAETGIAQPTATTARGSHGSDPNDQAIPFQRDRVSIIRERATIGRDVGSGGEKISLKERMKKNDAQPRQGTGFPMTGMALSAVALMLVVITAFVVWNSFVFDGKEMVGLQGATNKIINRLTDNKGSLPDQAWWDGLTKGNGIEIGNGYWLVRSGFKTQVSNATAQLVELQEINDSKDLKSAVASKISEAMQLDPHGVVGAILGQIEKKRTAAELVKQEKENARLAAKAKAEDEQQRLAAQQHAQEEAAKREQERLAAQQTKPKAENKPKVIDIKFLKFGDDTFGKLALAVSSPSTKGWLTNSLVDDQGFLKFTNGLAAFASQTSNLPESLKLQEARIKESLKANNVMMFATVDTTNGIHISYIYNISTIVRMHGGPFRVATNNAGNIEKFDTSRVPQILSLISTSLPLKYSIHDTNKNTSVIFEGDQNPLSVDDYSKLATLADRINSLRSGLQNKIPDPKTIEKNRKESAAQMAKKVESENDLNTSGPNLYKDIPMLQEKSKKSHNQPELPLNYNVWSTRLSKQDDASYISYIKYSLSYASYFFKDTNSKQYIKFQNLQNNISQIDGLQGLRKNVADYRKNLDSYTEIEKKNGKQANDQKFIDNLSNLISVLDEKKIIITSAPIIDFSDEKKKLGTINEIISGLSNGGGNLYQSRVEVFDGTNPLLIFTP